MKRLVRGDRGLSLIEVLIGMGLLAFTMTGLVLALSTGALATGKVTQRGTLQDLARSQMEYVKAQPYSAAPTSYPAITAQQPYTLAAVASPLGGSDNGIQLITVTVYMDGASLLALEGYKVNR